MSFSSGGGSGSIATGSDVSLSNPATGQVLGYDASVSKWKNGVVPTDGLALAINGGAENIVSIASATGAVQLNLASGNVFNVTLTGNTNFSFTGRAAGKAAAFTLYLSQDATGSRNVSWPGGVKWPGGTLPTLSISANAIDILVFESLTGTIWFGGLVGSNYS